MYPIIISQENCKQNEQNSDEFEHDNAILQQTHFREKNNTVMGIIQIHKTNLASTSI